MNKTINFPRPKLPPYETVAPIMDIAARLVASENHRYEPGEIVAHLESPLEFMFEGYDVETGEAILMPSVGDGFAEVVPANTVFSIALASIKTQKYIDRLN